MKSFEACYSVGRGNQMFAIAAVNIFARDTFYLFIFSSRLCQKRNFILDRPQLRPWMTALPL